jgi:hypothetical protein
MQHAATQPAPKPQIVHIDIEDQLLLAQRENYLASGEPLDQRGEEFGNLLSAFMSRFMKGKGRVIRMDKSGQTRVKARPLAEFDMFAILGSPDFYIVHDGGTWFLYLWERPALGQWGDMITVNSEGQITEIGVNAAEEFHLEQWKPFGKWPGQKR